MIDLSGFPLPENCPEVGACIRVEQPEPGLRVLILDPPHRKLAVLDLPLLRDLGMAIEEAEQDRDLKGLVITGRTPAEFAAGADIDSIASITDPALLERAVQVAHELFRRIENLKARTVAAVGGAVPGGAFELSLSCDFIVANDDKKTRIGLPEVLLGIVPGWGGCHRLPKRVGLPTALPAILTGRLFPAVKAKKAGMIDRLTKPEYLRRVASDLAMGRISVKKKGRGWKGWLIDRNPLAASLIASQARKQTLAKTHGLYPAPLRAIDLVVQAPRTSMKQAAVKEAKAIAELATSSVCKNLITIFKGSEEAKKLSKLADGSSPVKTERGAVIGAGVMGAAIAGVMAEKGVAVRLADLSEEALDRAVHEHRASVNKKRKRRRMKPHEADAALDRLDPSPGLIGFGRSQIVVEAVAEVLDVKRKLFGEVAEQVSKDCILATNTSSLSVDAIAETLPHPERVCGMHFFNPVRRMPLVEIIKGEHTSDQVVAQVAALALRMGKTPVVVKDVAGFLVNRILGPYLDEAIRLFQGGADPVHVDKLMVNFGMPMGPFTLLDEIGLDIAAHAGQSLFEAYGERMTPSDGIGTMVKPERLGKKTGRGFYDHPKGKGKKAKPEICSDLAQFQSGTFAKSLNDQQIIDRLVLAMVNEGARCMEENVVDSASQLDLATVFGTGFAPFRGGLLRYADSVGSAAVVEKLEAIASASDVSQRPGGRAKFTPAALLQQMARQGRGFHDPAPASSTSTAPQPVGGPA
ncbi:MAG: hypothetical protein DWQ01_09415 [Planctomycetota bacterium]|nr:MAG: hypothetical protein DWQ01_09415 [Planctomycetota bacterium]